jgi:hypothetical protein
MVRKTIRRSKDAFKWIVGILQKNNIPFQISGGLAAHIYGSQRPLADIDIEIPDKHFEDIILDVEKHVVYGPKRYVDKEWDILLMTMRYGNQDIDISGCETERLFDKKKKNWVKTNADLSKAVRKKVFGLAVPVIPKEDLIGYKSIIMRKVDIFDINSLKRQ